jgi:hypothetical protein
VLLEGTTRSHVHQKLEIYWTNIASTMACLNSKNGPDNGLHPLGVHIDQPVKSQVDMAYPLLTEAVVLFFEFKNRFSTST